MTTLLLFFILIGFIGTAYAEWDYVWYGYEDTGYFKAPIIYEIDQCNNRHAVACIMGDTNKYRIIISELYDPYGCTMRTHEWFHLMGFEEWEIPRCGTI